MTGSQLIPVIRVLNPFDPRQRVKESLTWGPNKTLVDYFPPVMVEHIVSVNGKVVPPEQWGNTYLAPTDNLVVCPVLEGGDGGKGILRVVGMIVVAVAAAYTGGAAAGAYASAFGVSATSTSAMIAGALASTAVMVGGSMLINSLLPAPQAASANGSSSNSSPSYGIDGAKNTSQEGLPVPVCYGTFRMAGNIIDMYVENGAVDPNGYSTQILHMLIAAGEGPIAGISDILFDNNEASLYQGVNTWTTLGTPDQTPLPGFSANISPFSFGEDLTPNWVYYTTSEPIDAFRVDFVAPNGLYQVDPNSGAESPVTVQLQVQYAPLGTQNWQDIQTNSSITWQKTLYANLSEDLGGWQYDAVTQVASYYINDNVGCCFPAGVRMLMADMTWKNIETVEVGDWVMGIEGKPVQIQSVKAPILGVKRMMRFADSSLVWSEEHLLWAKKDNKQWWWSCGADEWRKEEAEGVMPGLKDSSSIWEDDAQNVEFAHLKGWLKQEVVPAEGYDPNTRIYLPSAGGIPLIFNGYIATAGTDEHSYDYTKIDWQGLRIGG